MRKALEGTKTTGQVVRELGVSEVYLVNLFRLGKMRSPPIVQGKRRWGPEHVALARKIVDQNLSR